MSFVELPFETMEVIEGKARLVVPNLSRYVEGRRLEPAWAPVFYNPKMVENRHLSVVAAEAFRRLFMGGKKLRICEPLSASGVRSIRYALEVNDVDFVVANDIDPNAAKLIYVNAVRNNVLDKLKIYNIDANILLNMYAKRGHRFDIVDIDPFGSPVPFADAAVRSVRKGGMVCFTATDLAALMGVYPRACRRKYFGKPIRGDVAAEVGLRILIGYLVREAAKLEIGLFPVLAYYQYHYYRVYLIAYMGASHTDRALNNIGYMVHEINGLRRFLVRDPEEVLCLGRGYKVYGPLWIGPLYNKEFLNKVYEVYSEYSYLRTKQLDKLLSTILEECDLPPLYYTTSEICRHVKVREPSVSKVIECLKRRGFKASKTHFSTKGFRTDADLETIIECVVESSPDHQGARPNLS